ncbi:MAG: DUF4340 domain-containing protein [Pseudomonadota bacterium]
MKRNTLIVLGVFVGLLVVFLVFYLDAPAPPAPRIELPAILAEEALGEDGPVGALGPPDRIQFIRKGQEVVLVHTKGDWEVSSPPPSFARAAVVNAMLRAFEEPTVSSLGREVPKVELVHYGLGEDRMIRVVMYSEDKAILDLCIGDATKVDTQGTTDTNIMLSNTEMVFRVRGRDLRAPFDIDLEQLRDQKIFSFKKEDVRTIEITDPRSPGGVLNLERLPDGTETAWRSDSEKNHRISGLEPYFASLAALAATRFADVLPGAEAAALSKTYRIKVSTGTDELRSEQILELGAGRGAVWARVEGRKGVFQVSSASAKALMKTFNDFRDKRLFEFKKEEIQQIKLTDTSEKTHLSVERFNEGWIFGDTLEDPMSDAAANRLAAAVAALRTQEFVDRPLEGTGLEEPSYTLTIIISQQNNLIVRKLDIGDEIPRENEKASKRHWARLDDGDEVLQLADYTVKTLRMRRDDLRDNRIFRVKAEDIASVSINYPDAAVTLVKAGGTWKMTSPEELAAPQGVDTIIRTLADLSVKTLMPGVSPEEVRVEIGVAFKLEDGTEHGLTLSEEIVDGGNYAQSLGHPRFGDGVFTVSQYKAANLLKKLPDFKPVKKQGPDQNLR